MLVDADHPNAVEPGRVLDQKPVALGEDGVVRGVPGDAEPGSDPGDGEVVDTSARSAQASAPRVSFARGSATPVVSSCQNREQFAQEKRRTRSSSVVGR